MCQVGLDNQQQALQELPPSLILASTQACAAVGLHPPARLAMCTTLRLHPTLSSVVRGRIGRTLGLIYECTAGGSWVLALNTNGVTGATGGTGATKGTGAAGTLAHGLDGEVLAWEYSLAIVAGGAVILYIMASTHTHTQANSGAHTVTVGLNVSTTTTNSIASSIALGTSASSVNVAHALAIALNAVSVVPGTLGISLTGTT